VFFSRVIGEQIVTEMAPIMGTMVARVLVLDLLAEEGQELQSDLVRVTCKNVMLRIFL